MRISSLVAVLGMLAVNTGCATPQEKAQAQQLAEESAITAIAQKTGMNAQLVSEILTVSKTAYQKKGFSKTQAADQGVEVAGQKTQLTVQQKNDLHATLMRVL